MLQLNSSQRRYLSRQAHDLDPIVMVGKRGFTDQIVEAVQQALHAHELIKIRFVDYKADRVTITEELARRADAVVVRVIGNVAILFREQPDPKKRRYRLPAPAPASVEE
ncbi:ribosome assembly RNA-binding protein YhbY [Spirochaeta africana]|nr:ribosome assembly RNA-binding protein YhbY [Spirochaeta africana]